MMKKKSTKIISIIMFVLILLTGCSTAQGNNNLLSIGSSDTNVTTTEVTTNDVTDTNDNKASTVIESNENSLIDVTEIFSNRDLEQTVNLDETINIEVNSNEDVTIDQEGIYVLSGTAENVTVVVDTEDKVQLVLDEVSIINEESPAIYVKSADKVFITTTNTVNEMMVTGSFVSDGDTNLDSVIYSKSDLVINGLGSLEIVSNQGNGITSKDDLKITGGTYIITSNEDAIEANDSIRIYAGTFTIDSSKDAIHSENDEDDSLGYVYIRSGDITITTSDDGIYGNSFVQIDGGTINIISSTEGIEGTHLQFNGGNITIYATDDGINATDKTNNDVIIEVNGGEINVAMASGDTDGFDSNGDIYINGGIINVDAASAFDSDGEAVLNGGVVTVNGEVITEIVQMQMGKGKSKKN
jgi:hypothetical protein